MTERRKAQVGDTIRLNGKNPARRSGEHIVDRVVEGRHTHPDGGTSTYWVRWRDNSDDPAGSAWELQFDIVEPDSKFNKGDKVKLTPKDGGETVIYGEVSHLFWGNDGGFVDVRLDGDVAAYGGRPFSRQKWNVELVKPTTEEILNGLGENAYVAHRTDAAYYGYYKRDGKWYDADGLDATIVGVDTVAYWMEEARGGEKFEIIFEGIKDE